MDKKISKPEMCHQIGACILIDDSIDYTAECAKFMEHVILFDWNGQYGWNQKEIKHENIYRLKTWEEIGQFLSFVHLSNVKNPN